MTSTSLKAAHHSRLPGTGLPRDARRLALIAKQIEKYPKPYRKAIRVMAARHPYLADLASSFPALLFAITIRRRDIDGEAIVRQVIAGAPLRELAALAGIPMWTRPLPPQCFWSPLPDLPDGDLFRRRIGNSLRVLRKYRWTFLLVVSEAARWCGEGFALWSAREFTSKGNHFDPSEIRLLALWAWHSHQPNAIGHRYCEVRWNMAMSYRAALKAAENWIDSMQNLVAQDATATFSNWLKGGEFGGFSFVPLTSAEEVAAEASAMRNCMRGFGDELLDNTLRFCSVRRDGKRYAVLSVQRYHHFPIPTIGELRGRDNKGVSLEVWIAAARWLYSHDIAAITADRPPENPKSLPARAWMQAWKPYWIAMGSVPPLLPLRYKSNWRWTLRKDLRAGNLPDD